MARAVTWVSHRGYSVGIDENTFESFDRSIELGFTNFETDLRMTRDGHIVLSHDRDLSRIGGPASFVDEMTRAELEQVKLRHGSRVLFFDEFVERYAAYNWTFDMKTESARSCTDFLYEWTHSKNTVDWFLSHARFLLWSRSDLSYFQERFPQASCLPGEFECWRAGLSAIFSIPNVSGIEKGRTYSLKPELWGMSLFNPRIVEYYQKRGGRVLGYLPESESESKAALRAGVDEVLTNGEIYTL